MRSSVDHQEYSHPAYEADRNTLAGIEAVLAICVADAAPELVAQIERARGAARNRAPLAATLLHAWMTAND